MVNLKNKKSKSRAKSSRSSDAPKHTKTPSARVHTKKTRSSLRSHLTKGDHRVFVISRKVIIAVILVAMLAVILALLTSILNNPESLVTHKIESITADYYENYFYPRIETYGTTDKTLSDILSRYTETGFSRVTLRQLLLFDSERYASSADFLTKYCDPETTYVRIYPEEPFTKSDYRTEYHYTCTF